MTTCHSLPIYLDRQTFLVPVGMSQRATSGLMHRSIERLLDHFVGTRKQHGRHRIHSGAIEIESVATHRTVSIWSVPNSNSLNRIVNLQRRDSSPRRSVRQSLLIRS
jgi:hypothetical protein